MSAFDPLRTLPIVGNKTVMRCFYVLVHGKFEFHVDPRETGLNMKGFYAGRHLLAHNPGDAIERAFAKIKHKLGARNADVRDGLISIDFEAEEVERSRWWNIFRRSNRAHAFYTEE